MRVFLAARWWGSSFLRLQKWIWRRLFGDLMISRGNNFWIITRAWPIFTSSWNQIFWGWFMTNNWLCLLCWCKWFIWFLFWFLTRNIWGLFAKFTSFFFTQKWFGWLLMMNVFLIFYSWSRYFSCWLLRSFVSTEISVYRWIICSI